MRACQILRIDRLVDPMRQTVAGRQGLPHNDFEPGQDRILRHLSGRDQGIAVGPIRLGQDLMERGRFLKRDVTHRGQPILNILNIFKNHLVTSLPRPRPALQIWRP